MLCLCLTYRINLILRQKLYSRISLHCVEIAKDLNRLPGMPNPLEIYITRKSIYAFKCVKCKNKVTDFTGLIQHMEIQYDSLVRSG